MPRPRKPAALLDLSGNLRADRHRKRHLAPDAGAELDAMAAPLHLSPAAADAWRQIIRTAPAGLLGEADALAVESLAVAVAAHREASRLVAVEGVLSAGSMGQPVMSGALRAMLGASMVIAKLCADLGMSPQARLRLADAMPDPADKPADALDPWAQFMQPLRPPEPPRKRGKARANA